MARYRDVVLYLSICFICLCQFPSTTGASAAQGKDVALKRRERHTRIINKLPQVILPAVMRTKRAAFHTRAKRSVQPKELQDPNNCIHTCWEGDDERVDQVLSNFENKVHVADPEVSQSTIMSNLGPLMADLCKASKATKSCFTKCPSSQLKDVVVADYYEDEVACDSSSNGGDIGSRATMSCLNFTLAVSHETCEKDCHGEVTSLREVTGFDIDRNESDSSEVYYETDSKKNYDSCQKQCKIMTCTRDCTKDFLRKRNCGKKAAELYEKQLKAEPKSALVVLQKLGALKSVPSECNSFK